MEAKSINFSLNNSFLKYKKYISSNLIIFILAYIFFVIIYWKHFAALLYLPYTDGYMSGSTALFVFLSIGSLVISKIMSYIVERTSDGRTSRVAFVIFLIAILLLFTQDPNRSRVYVFHEVMKTAPHSGFVRATEAIRQCDFFVKQEDWGQAYRYCLKGSAEKSPEAQTNLAYMYFQGLGPLEHKQGDGSPNGSARKRLISKFIFKLIPKKFQTDEDGKISTSDANLHAIQLLEKAAEKGVSAAQYNIGVFHIGHNSPRLLLENADFDRQREEENVKAFEYTRAAASQGDAEAIYNLAVMYDIGSGVKENRKEANRLYKIAASKGFKLAENVLWLNSF